LEGEAIDRALASFHHERLDGSGYHRAAAAAEITPPARLLAAADAYHAMTEPRPHRAALAPEQAAETLGVRLVPDGSIPTPSPRCWRWPAIASRESSGRPG
jgi:HD domain-containing protein